MSEQPKEAKKEFEKPTEEKEESRDAAAQSECPMNHCCHVKWSRT